MMRFSFGGGGVVIGQKDTRVWKDIVPTLVSILKQVVQKRLPKHYEYHHVPAPWTQVKILRLLGILGANDKRFFALLSFSL